MGKDEPAWKKFYAGMVPLIRSVCITRVPSMSGEDLDDVVQSVFEKLIEDDCEALRVFNPKFDIEPYVSTIALNAARNIAKKASRRREIPVGGSVELEEILHAKPNVLRNKSCMIADMT